MRTAAIHATALVLFAGCVNWPRDTSLGHHHREITTPSRAAQAQFDAGLLLCYGFNHDEAVRRFEAALAADPACAMAWWGIAYALGPNINARLRDESKARRADAAAQHAVALAGPCTAVERALIAAMAQRYADPPPADRAPLDRAFADAMRAVWHEHRGDADAGALFAEALLDLAPWDQWTREGRPQPGTEEVLAVLGEVLTAAPDHPQALHLWIHATEASPQPGRALEQAKRLPLVAPGLGHLVHMPAHTYERVGRYADALAANLAGAALDEDYFESHGEQGSYHFYLAHNLHFAAYAAMFLGDSAAATSAARRLVATMPEQLLQRAPGAFDGFFAVPLHVLLRFGRWQQVLAEPEPAVRFKVARALWHYARGLALTNLGDLPAAAAEQAAFASAAAAVPASATLGLTPAPPVLEVAAGMLAGELAFRQGDRAAAFARLRAAVAAEDALRYDEPPAWMMPVRHALGALLLEDGRVADAEPVYLEDLQRHPENGWSLHGLLECQRGRGAPEAAATAARLQTAWARADVTLPGSCFCRH